MLSFFFTLNLTFVHHPLLVVLNGQNINLDLFYDRNTLTKNEQCKYAMIIQKLKLYVYTLLSMLISNICYKQKTQRIYLTTILVFLIT
jgi:hypothetical protein